MFRGQIVERNPVPSEKRVSHLSTGRRRKHLARGLAAWTVIARGLAEAQVGLLRTVT